MASIMSTVNRPALDVQGELRELSFSDLVKIIGGITNEVKGGGGGGRGGGDGRWSGGGGGGTQMEGPYI
jgi:hypothetical protein